MKAVAPRDNYIWEVQYHDKRNTRSRERYQSRSPSRWHQGRYPQEGRGRREECRWERTRSSKELQSQTNIPEVHTIIGGVGKSDRVVRDGSQLDPVVKEKIVSFLHENCDVFTWSYEDMPGISPSVMVHNLNVEPSFKPVQQRRKGVFD